MSQRADVLRRWPSGSSTSRWTIRPASRLTAAPRRARQRLRRRAGQGHGGMSTREVIRVGIDFFSEPLISVRATRPGLRRATTSRCSTSPPSAMSCSYHSGPGWRPSLPYGNHRPAGQDLIEHGLRGSAILLADGAFLQKPSLDPHLGSAYLHRCGPHRSAAPWDRPGPGMENWTPPSGPRNATAPITSPASSATSMRSARPSEPTSSSTTVTSRSRGSSVAGPDPPPGSPGSTARAPDVCGSGSISATARSSSASRPSIRASGSSAPAGRR